MLDHKRSRKSTQTAEAIEIAANIDVMDYAKRWGRYRIRFSKADVKEHSQLIRDLPPHSRHLDTDETASEPHFYNPAGETPDMRRSHKFAEKYLN